MKGYVPIRVEGVIKALRKGDVKELRKISDRILAEGAVAHDKNLVRLSVAIHSLAKIAEKDYYRKNRELWKKFLDDVEESLRIYEKTGDVEMLEEVIVDFDRHFGRYTPNVLEISTIRRGSTLDAGGISLTLASKLVDVPEIEILKHIGKTRVVDEDGVSKAVEKRLRDAEEVL